MATKTQKRSSLPASVSVGERVDVAPEFEGVLDMALKSARTGSVPVYVLNALQAALDDAFRQVPDRSLRSNPPKPWEPTPEQTWNPKMKRADGKRLSAWARYQQAFGDIPYDQRPYAHQLRQHPATREFYEALCVFVSRNKAKGMAPSTIGELFPVAEEARGGGLSNARRNAE